MKDWKYIDEYDSLPEADFIHCDTRDFHILCCDGDRAERHRAFKGIRRAAGYGTLSDCKFRRDEILGALKALENNSGGKGSWRMISTKIGSGWLKYVRFIKTTETVDLLGRTEPVYICYTTSGGSPYVVPREELAKDIDEDTLNHIEDES